MYIIHVRCERLQLNSIVCCIRCFCNASFDGTVVSAPSFCSGRSEAQHKLKLMDLDFLSTEAHAEFHSHLNEEGPASLSSTCVLWRGWRFDFAKAQAHQDLVQFSVKDHILFSPNLEH